jgi:hypothetical protein
MAGPPVVTSVTASPTLGGVVNITGNNLAFDFLTLNEAGLEDDLTMWSGQFSTVTINGAPCTDVKMVQRPRWFVSEGVLSCVAPPGYGTNLDIVVSVGFVSPGDVAPIYDTSVAVRVSVSLTLEWLQRR